MAFTTRDIMFALRAQDFASRRISGVGSAFNRLGKQMEQSKARAAAFATEVQRATDVDIANLRKSREEVAKRNEGMKRQIAGMRDSNAQMKRSLATEQRGYKEQIDTLRTRSDVMKSDIRAAQERSRIIRSGLQQETAAIKSQMAPMQQRNQLLNDDIRAQRARTNDIRTQSGMIVDGMRAQNLQLERVIQNEQIRQRHGAIRGQEALRQSNAEIASAKEMQRVGNLLVQEEQTRTRQRLSGHKLHMSNLQRELDANNRTISAYQERIRIGERGAAREIAANDKLIARQRGLVAQNTELERSLTRQSSAAARATQKKIDHNNATIAGLNRSIARGKAQIAGYNDQAKAAQASADARIAANQMVAEQEQESIQRQQQLAQRFMMAGAAATIAGTIMAGVGAKIVSSFAEATKETAEWQHGIALAKTQLDGVTASVGELTDMALRVGRAVPTEMENIPETIYQIFSTMNVSMIEAEGLLKGFAKEAVAGNADIQDAAKSTIAILNGMGMATEDLTRIQDFQFQTVRKGWITYDELANNIGKLIPPLRRMGQEIETGGAMIAFLTRQGLSAEMATTAAARSLELFSDPRVISRLEAQGITMRDNAGEFANLGDILGEMNEKFDGLTRPERAEAMREIFGGAGFRIQARRFLDTVFENFDEFEWHIEQAIDNVGAMGQAFDIMAAEPRVRLQQLTNDMFALRHEIGVAFLPIMEKAIELVRTAVNWFESLDEKTKSNIIQWVALAGAGMIVVGMLTAMAGIGITVAGMLVMLGAGAGTAIASVALFLPVVSGLTALFGMLILNGFDVVDTFKAIFGEFKGAEGVAKAVSIALGTLTVALIAFNIASGSTIPSIAGIRTGLVAMGKAAKKAMWQLVGLGVAHPVIAGLMLATAAAVAIWRSLRKETEELNEAVQEHTGALSNQIDTITSSAEEFENYKNTLNDTNKETALAALKEEGLLNALSNTATLRNGKYLAGIANENGSRRETLGLLDQEIATAWEREKTIHAEVSNSREAKEASTEHRRELERLREVYVQRSRASDTATQSMIDEMRAQDGLTGMVGEYMSLQQHRERGNSIRAQQLREEILLTLETKGALEGMSDAEIEAMMSGEGLAEVTDGLNQSLSDAAQSASNLASIISAAADPMGTYNDILAEMNESGRKMAEETAANTKKGSDSWEEYYTDVEASAQAFFQAQEQQLEDQREWFKNLEEIREKGHEEYSDYLMSLGPEQAALVADINKQSEDEIAKSAERQQQLLIENGEKQIALWIRSGQQIVDETGRLSTEAVDAMKENLDIAPGMIETILEDGNLVVEAQLGYIEQNFLGFSKSATRQMLDEMEWGRDELGLIMESMASVSEDGADSAIQALARGLGKSEGQVVSILLSYANSMGDALNPVLDALGQTKIPGTNITSPIGRARAIASVGKRNMGGEIPGRGPDRDTVMAMLTPGEFVLRRKAVDKLDPQSLHELNRTGDPSAMIGAYNAGGWVKPEDLPTPPTSYAPPVDPFTRPAHAAANTMYEDAKGWLAEQTPPLGSGVGYQAMMEAIRKVFPGTPLHSGLRPGAITATGNPSYHAQGRAVDIPPDMRLFNWIRDNYTPQTRELIFSPAGFNQVHNGGRHMYSGITRSMHWDHIHWAMANGGMGRVNSPTWFLAGENGPEDFAFAPKKAGDGPGIPSFQNGGMLDQFMQNTTFQNATDFRMEGVQTIQSAFSALESYEKAQQALQDAYTEVDKLGKRSVEIASEIEQKELKLSQLAKNRTATAKEELDILNAQRSLRDAQWDLDAAGRGVHDLNNELAVLNQEMRVEEMREAFKAMQEGPGDPEGLQKQIASVEEAQAAYTKARFEVERVKTQIPYMDNELDALLLQFKAENELADASKMLTEEKRKLDEMQKGNTYSAQELRKAEIELALAEEELLKLHESRKYGDEALREAQLQLKLAEDRLTESKDAAKAPTQEMIDLENQLKNLNQEQIDNSEAQIEARNNITKSELDAINATMGLVKAGQELANLSPSQLSYFNKIAKQSGVATKGINDLNAAISTLSGAGVQDPRTRLHKEVQDLFSKYGVPLTYGTKESGSNRVKRLANEILTGKNTMNDLERSVQIMAAKRKGVSLNAIQSGYYDSGGMLLPGTTLATNNTGKNEHILTGEQFSNLSKGNNLTIERGAVNITIEGDAAPGVEQQIEETLQQVFDDMMMQLRSN